MRYNIFYERFNEMICEIFEKYTDDDFYTDYEIATETNKALSFLLNTCINHRDHVLIKLNKTCGLIHESLFDFICNIEMSEGFNPIDVLKKIRESNKQLKLEIDQLKLEIENIKEENKNIKEEIFQCALEMNEEETTTNIVVNQTSNQAKPKSIKDLLKEKQK